MSIQERRTELAKVGITVTKGWVQRALKRMNLSFKRPQRKQVGGAHRCLAQGAHLILALCAPQLLKFTLANTLRTANYLTLIGTIPHGQLKFCDESSFAAKRSCCIMRHFFARL
jgi:hypothetical protein